MTTIKVTTKELYDSYVTAVSDIIWSDPFNAQPSILEDMRALARGDMNYIRKMFMDGSTVFLVPQHMGILDVPGDSADEVEIRVYAHNEKLLGVVIDSEILF